MLESAHDILLELVLELVLLRIGPPPTVLKEEPEASNGVINALTIFDLLPLTVGKRVVRRRMMTNSVDPRSKLARSTKRSHK